MWNGTKDNLVAVKYFQASSIKYLECKAVRITHPQKTKTDQIKPRQEQNH